MEYLEKELTIEEYLTKYVDVDKFIEYCKVCPNYGKVWTCAPFNFNPLDYWKKFSRIKVIASKIYPKEGMDVLSSWEMLKEYKKKMLEYTYSLEKNIEGSISLSAGACDICDSCERLKGLPCKHPDLMRYSIESIGGDVNKTIKDLFDIEIKWAKKDEVQEYFVLCGGLLIK